MREEKDEKNKKTKQTNRLESHEQLASVYNGGNGPKRTISRRVIEMNAYALILEKRKLLTEFEIDKLFMAQVNQNNETFFYHHEEYPIKTT